MIHHFVDSLAHEREQASKADSFYRERLHATCIQRYNSDSLSDMEQQHRDIDVQIVANGITYNISEKFRDKNFNDIFIEIYSKYPHKMGWMHTGSPNAIVYFMPDNVYWIVFNSLREFCIQKLFPALDTEWFEEIYKSSKSILKKTICIDEKKSIIHLIQAHNFEGKSWETIGVSVPFETLKYFGVKFKKL